MRCAAVILMLCTLAALTNAACWFTEKEKPRVIVDSDGNTRIEDTAQNPCLDEFDNQTYPVVSTWRSRKCQRCTCTERGMECCHMMGSPRGYDRDCEAHYDWENCSFKVVKKSDEGIFCPHDAVGK
ncbi:beta-microseminoprotein-like [Alosa sapidissima]|uniref:beta-microseminoprotein-like n=1 Tax=Alosa sapidissima TaxID=34773 RepID=UPI001C0A0BE4|nr:beta-microseminoprotein-like [Alosa sapidissima]